MPRHILQYNSSAGTGYYVADDQFGANALHNVNIADSTFGYSPSEGFQEALESHEITNLRYPGGHVENTLDVTFMPSGDIREEVRSFLDWCVESNSESRSYQVTFVLPTKANIPAWKIENFVYALLSEYGDVISAFEIGNEYSIGTEVDNADRSIHPEFIEGSNFIAAMNEIEYSISANRVINAAQNALDRLEAEQGSGAPDPRILLQMAETNGAASNYKGGDEAGNFDAANEAILSLLNQRAIEAVDGAVVHYYYNVTREDGLRFTDAEDWREARMIDLRFQNFRKQIGKDVDLFVTEWNVVAGNATQHGAASASVLLEMFEFMVRMGVDDAHIWPLQHRTPNSIMGNRNSEDMEYTMSGAAFSLMSESLRPRENEGGQPDRFESMLSDWAGGDGSVEINHFASDYQDVLFVSLRSEAPSTVDLDLGSLVDGNASVTIDRLTIDPNSSDGLSDFANEIGGDRVPRRRIDQQELDQLETLAFFDASNPNHVRHSGGNILTYLPPLETIIPLVANPTGIEDYYFTSEIDVDPLLMSLDPPGPGDDLSFDLMPFDVVRIVVDHPNRADGNDYANIMTGGAGRDVLLGRGGDDTLIGGGGDDKLKGGWGGDFMHGGDGADTLVGGGGSNVFYAGDGHDSLESSGGADLLFSGAGDDVVELSSDETFADGYFAFNVLTGAGGLTPWSVSVAGFNRYDAVTDGGAGIDEIHLGNGNDAFFLDDVLSDFHGDLGRDPVARFNGIERILAGGGNDVLDMTSSRFGHTVTGMELHGQGGNDTIWGTNGDDRLFGGNGADVLEGGWGQNVLTGGDGADTFHFLGLGAQTQTITDFSADEGDVIAFHPVNGTSPAGFTLEASGQELRLVSPDGAVVLSLDVGGQASDLAANGLSGAHWLDFL